MMLVGKDIYFHRLSCGFQRMIGGKGQSEFVVRELHEDGRGNFFGILDKRIEFPEVSPVLSSGRIAPVDEIAIIFLAGAVVVTGILAAGTDGRGAEHRRVEERELDGRGAVAQARDTDTP
tara:strand:+ start:2154 stop:2513 length:360 start_codon:yes stop_codon:yes gene_type:complete